MKLSYALPLVAYGAWLIAVVLLVVARLTPLHQFPGVETGVIVGAAVFTVVGAVQLGCRGVSLLATKL